MDTKLIFYLCVSIALTVANTENQNQNDGSCLGENYNQFALDLLVGHQKEFPGRSIVLTAKPMFDFMAVLALKSEGKTFEYVTDVLGIKNKTEIKRRFKKSNENTFRADVDTPLRYNIRVYADNEYKFCPDFKKTFSKYFLGTTGNADFDDPSKAAETINQWINRQEVDQIGNRDLVNPNIVKKDAGFIIVSSLEMEVDYDSGFNPKNIISMDFNVDNKITTKKDYLYGAGIIKYADVEQYDAQAVSISMKEGNFTLLILIPKKINGLPKLVEEMKSETIVDDIVADQEYKCVEIYIPIGKATEQEDLTNILRKIGLDIIFDKERAEFSGITENNKPGVINKFVTEVYLVAKMLEDNNYNEMKMPDMAEYLCPDSDELLTIKIDRPFAYHILDNISGTKPTPFLISGLYYGEVN